MTRYLLLALFSLTSGTVAMASSAQVGLVSLTEPRTFVLGQDSVPALPPLSGITVLPNQATGRYTLEFSQELEEPATVSVTNAKKKVVYTNSLAPQAFASVKHLDVGKLANGSYLVEVKTSNTTYWKKLDVRSQTVKSTKAGKTTKAGKSKKSGKSKRR